MAPRLSPLQRLFPALALSAGLLAPRPADACGACGAGDTGLTAVGAGAPGEQRFRASAELRFGTVTLGGPRDETHVDEQRLDFTTTYTLIPALRISAIVPVLRRDVALPDRAASSFVALGDMEARVDGALSVDLRPPLRRALTLFGGVRLPTAPEQSDGGAPLPAALQPGWGAIAPFVGASYSLGWDRFNATLAAALYLPFAMRPGPHAGSALRTSAALAFAPHPKVALRWGIQAKLEASTESNGKGDPNSGGFLGFVTTEVLVAPSPGWTCSIGGYFPAVQLLRGAHRQGTIAGASAAYSF